MSRKQKFPKAFLITISIILIISVCWAPIGAKVADSSNVITNTTTTATTINNIKSTYSDATLITTTESDFTQNCTENCTEKEKTDVITSANTTTKKVTTTTKENKTKYPLKYKDSSLLIKIDKIWYNSAYCYVADIQLTDYSRFYTVCAKNTYGEYQRTSEAAKANNAIFAVNGDYSAPEINNPVVRNKKVLNEWDCGCNAPANYNSYTGQFGSVYDLGINGISYTQAVAEHKVTDTFCFGPAFIMAPEGNAVGGKCQRTFIGTDGKPGHFIVCVSEGRMSDGVSAGLTDQDCVDILLKYGCKFGVPLDGGGSSTMVFQGEILNQVKSERRVVDFLIFK